MYLDALSFKVEIIPDSFKCILTFSFIVYLYHFYSTEYFSFHFFLFKFFYVKIKFRMDVMINWYSMFEK